MAISKYLTASDGSILALSDIKSVSVEIEDLGNGLSNSYLSIRMKSGWQVLFQKPAELSSDREISQLMEHMITAFLYPNQYKDNFQGTRRL